MSEARALTNLVGNGMATIVVAKWEGALDEERMHRHLNQETDQEADHPETVLVTEDLSKGTHIPGQGPSLTRPAE
jgi:aerobic C4-dicarboxylate transport protein